ncbi:hypothetical protein CSW59_09680 [Caulobacter sp. BP25]|nr:hypothetical protein CSW59_09680 [Caulobacter sp. BP25]
MHFRKWIRNFLVVAAVVTPLNIATTNTATALPDYCTAAAWTYCRGETDINGYPLVFGSPEFQACVAAIKPHLTECTEKPVCLVNGKPAPC